MAGLPYATSLSSLSELSAIDEKLAELLHKAQTHAQNQKRIEELEDALLQHEIDWRREINQLESDRKVLKAIVDRGKKEKEAIGQARKGVILIHKAYIPQGRILNGFPAAALKPSTILSYARLLAPYTSAPPQHRSVLPGILGSNQPPPSTGPGGLPPGSILPYPTEEVMRRGILAFADVSNIGETTDMTGGKSAKWFRAIRSLQFCVQSVHLLRVTYLRRARKPKQADSNLFLLQLPCHDALILKLWRTKTRISCWT